MQTKGDQPRGLVVDVPVFEVCLFIAKAVCRANRWAPDDVACEDCAWAADCEHIAEAQKLAVRIPSLREARRLEAA